MSQYAPGKVTIGFSNPYVATYTAASGNITFGTPTKLARGVSVSLEPTVSEDNNFYADDEIAESDSGRFTGGTLTLTVDGLFIAAEKLILGLPEAGEDGWTAKGDSANPPYVSVGYITKSMSNGAEIWTPTIILKTKFNEITKEANTTEDEIDWQTEELTATIARSENANHDWCWLGPDCTTLAEALSKLQTKLGVEE